MADALAPALPLAQAIGRWGNWFNQELYGRPTSLPWGLHIDVAHRMAGYLGDAYYQPTFLYEFLWDVAVAGVVIWADRRWKFTRGRGFALYVALYTIGRGWIEALRIDDAHKFFGLRLNDWTSVVVFLGAVGYFIAMRPKPGSGRHEADPDAAEAPTLTA
jgi:prolipoprotein diacylglyceryl transferase